MGRADRIIQASLANSLMCSDSISGHPCRLILPTTSDLNFFFHAIGSGRSYSNDPVQLLTDLATHLDFHEPSLQSWSY